VERAAVEDLVARVQPDQVYYLAAHHRASEGPREPIDEEVRRCADVHVVGLSVLLEAIRKHAKSACTFYAGSSHMFGDPTESPQTERTPFVPRSPYAITKVAGAQLCAMYREQHGLHVSVGILYNHESPRRSDRFVSMKLVLAARRAKEDPTHRVTVGSLAATVDWGYAPDYVDAMMRIVRLPQADDFIIATGEPHTVAELAEAAFDAVGLDWRAHVVESEEVAHLSASPGSASKLPLIGNAAKLRAAASWRPRVTFRDMVVILVSEMAR